MRTGTCVPRQGWPFIVLGALLVLGLGCSRQLTEPPTPTGLPETFSRSGSGSTPDEWWQAFNDTSLNQLIDEALTQNLDLLSSWDRLAQARAIARKADAALWPWADAQGGAIRTRQHSTTGTVYTSTYSMDLAASYELDLWSRLKSTQQAAWLDAEAQREAVVTTAIALSASVTNTWYQLAEAKALARVIDKQIETNRQVLEIVTVQFRKGMTSAADVLRQRQLVAATEATSIVVEETTQLLQHRLSVLLGRPPALAWQEEAATLPEVPPLPDVGIPTDVLWRRPDVRAAYRQLQAADQRLAVAVADQYPRLSLSAGVGSSAPSLHSLFDVWTANLIANAVQPLFDAGWRKAEVHRQSALVAEAMHTWQQAILTALQDVEDALVQEHEQRRTLKSLQQQLHLARQTAERNRQRYIKGQIDYIRVLESLQSLQSLERSVIAAQRAVVQSRIALYRSLAGGWDLSRPPAESIAAGQETPAFRRPAMSSEKERL